MFFYKNFNFLGNILILRIFLTYPISFSFSRISKFVKEKEQSSLLITLLLPFLYRGSVAQVWIHSSYLSLKWQFIIRFICEK